MTALFPTFSNIWQRAKHLLATDIRSIWQALEGSEEPTGEGFHDGYLIHPPI